MPSRPPTEAALRRQARKDAAANATAAERADSRAVSQIEMARIMDVHVSTVRNWIEAGCPIHRQKAREVMMDPAAVRIWSEKVAFAKGEAKGAKNAAVSAAAAAELDPPEDGRPSTPVVAMSMSDMLKLEQIKLARLKIGREAEILIPRSVPEAKFERAMGLIRQAVMAVPERLSRDMVGFDEDMIDGWRRKAMGHCRSALVEGEKALVSEMPKDGSESDDDGGDDE